MCPMSAGPSQTCNLNLKKNLPQAELFFNVYVRLLLTYQREILRDKFILPQVP